MKKFKHKQSGLLAIKQENKVRFIVEEIENSDEWEEIIEKKPIFVTEDGVEVREEDEYWFVNKLFNYYPSKAQSDSGYVGNKQFSTKEAAQQYIDLHKPKYSLKDVEDAGYFLHVLDRGLIINKLKNLNK